MPHPADPVREADFTVRLCLPDDVIADEDWVTRAVARVGDARLNCRVPAAISGGQNDLSIGIHSQSAHSCTSPPGSRNRSKQLADTQPGFGVPLGQRGETGGRLAHQFPQTLAFRPDATGSVAAPRREGVAPQPRGNVSQSNSLRLPSCGT